MNTYVIIVQVYDQENSQAYPLGGVFQTYKKAKEYIREKYQEVKSEHWTKDKKNGVGSYSEEIKYNGTAFHAQDSASGQSLDIDIYYLPLM